MPDYDSRAYALINRWDPAHLEKIDRLMPLDPGDRVLEIGCGRGHLTARLAERGVDIVGIDANPRAADVAETGRVRHMRAEGLEFEDGEFDAVVSVHALEHIPPLEEALAESVRVMKPGSRALHIYPAEPIQGLFAIPTSIILHGTPLKARKVHCHKLWPRKLLSIVEPMGLEEVHTEFNLLKSPQFVSVFHKT